MYTWYVTLGDGYGVRKTFIIKAKSKHDAIQKASKKSGWFNLHNCTLAKNF